MCSLWGHLPSCADPVPPQESQQSLRSSQSTESQCQHTRPIQEAAAPGGPALGPEASTSRKSACGLLPLDHPPLPLARTELSRTHDVAWSFQVLECLQGWAIPESLALVRNLRRKPAAHQGSLPPHGRKQDTTSACEDVVRTALQPPLAVSAISLASVQR